MLYILILLHCSYRCFGDVACMIDTLAKIFYGSLLYVMHIERLS